MNSLVQLPICSCGSGKVMPDFTSSTRLMQFLIGLYDTYEILRNQIINFDAFPSVHKLYSMDLSVEKQKEVRINFSLPNEVFVMLSRSFNANMNDRKQLPYKPKYEFRNWSNGDRYCDNRLV